MPKDHSAKPVVIDNFQRVSRPQPHGSQSGSGILATQYFFNNNLFSRFGHGKRHQWTSLSDALGAKAINFHFVLEHVKAVGFGDADLKTLYVTAIDGELFSARTERQGRLLYPTL